MAIHSGASVAANSTRIRNANPAVVGLTPGISRSIATDAATAPSAATTRTESRVCGVEHCAAAHILTSPRPRVSFATFYGFFMTFLCGRILRWDERGIMLTLVQIQRSATSSDETVIARCRLCRVRQAPHLTTPIPESLRGHGDPRAARRALRPRGNGERLESSSVCSWLPVLALAIIEGIQWWRLVRRLDRVRAEVQTIRKS